jgi:hypothetical protein
MGLILNSVWVLIQRRSSSYIENWKSQVKALETGEATETYSPKVKGYEMRKLAMILPIPYLIIWTSVIIQALYNIAQENMTNTQTG